MSRWIRVDADVFEHAVFAVEPFSEREAWLWLIAKAAWKETKHRIGSQVVVVPVGSVFLTLREMQAVWRWKSDKRVRSFLSRLENERMVEVKTDAGKTQITICNYSRFQNSERTEDASGTHRGRMPDALKTPIHQDTKDTSSVPSDVCPVPAKAAPASPTVFELPALQNQTVPISQSDIAEWSEAFPAVDIRQQLGAMKAWLNANSKNRKTASGMKRFIVSWLSREQNRGGSIRSETRGPPPQQREPDLADLANERARQLREHDDGRTIEGSYQRGDHDRYREAVPRLAASEGQSGRAVGIVRDRLPQGHETRDRDGGDQVDPGRARRALEVIRTVAGGAVGRDP